PPVIGSVIAGSEADKLDLRKNDLITTVNNNPVKTWREAQAELTRNQNELINLKIQRGTDTISRSISASLLKKAPGFGWRVNIPPVVGDITSESPAERANFLPGDRIIEIAGHPINDWADISPKLQETAGKEIVIRIQRQNQISSIRLAPIWNQTSNHWIIGISSQSIRVYETIGDSFSLGVQRVITMSYRTLEFLYQLVSFQADTDSVGGPIMIVQMVGQAAESNLSSLISLIAFISLQFAIFNLLPIPALDGGHIFFLGMEKIKGSSLSQGFRLLSQKIGFTLLLFLIIYISIQDGLRIFNQ
ncbi:MAG: RIP metalloprotease RseP, partial [bacterium]